MSKNKFYVVWVGRKTGIFYSWKECQAQTDKFPNGKYHGFKTVQAAEKAFATGWEAYYGKPVHEVVLSEKQLHAIGKPILNSLSVDAAWNTQTGVVEFRCVGTGSRKQIFSSNWFKDGTINMGEFIVIVLALSYCKKHGLTLPIYSDSTVAIKWVMLKNGMTKHPRTLQNKELFRMFDRANSWLKENESHNAVLKWETKAWGENPADFGRK